MYSANNYLFYRLIRRWVARAILLLGAENLGFSNRSKTLLKYWDENGEKKVFNHSLKEGGIVLDVGGHLGYFTDKILRSNPTVYVFEPASEFYKYLKKKYKNNNKVIVCPHGLTNRNTEQYLYVSGEKSSYYGSSGKKQKTKLVDVFEFFEKHFPRKKVALVSINIEGGEYDLLERIIKTGLMARIRILQVQFHKIGVDYKKKRSILNKEILKTHKIKYSYPFVWEAFVQRSS